MSKYGQSTDNVTSVSKKNTRTNQNIQKTGHSRQAKGLENKQCVKFSIFLLDCDEAKNKFPKQVQQVFLFERVGVKVWS